MNDEGEVQAALYDLFCARAGDLGVDVERVADARGLAAIVARYAGNVGADTVIVAHEVPQALPELAERLAEAGVNWTGPSEVEQTRDAPFGVSLARLAVAETGSLLLAETTLADRAIGLLTGTHLIVCPVTALVASLAESAAPLRSLAARSGGAQVTLVTGPSRTADIERVLTVGVQGPGRVIACFVGD